MTQKPQRCVVYTRKSTEEGLEQSFNSLDAQRDACQAYIKSQAHEGWRLVETRYDDGGFSGGTMHRPALQRLLDDIKLGAIDVVVVYKVDRLTRSLSDFSKIVEIFDVNDTSFVSITQQFNTTTSMGRLTLNVLLSFAQFEREVTGERIRDKFAASRRKGLWMGGTTPLGYRVVNRHLMVHEADAKLVRHIYQRLLVRGSVAALYSELKAKGIKRSIQTTERGKTVGGRQFSRGTLDHILQNRIYRGIIVYKGETHPGQHRSIISQVLWERVQSQLQAQRGKRAVRAVASPHLLIGRIHDDQGHVMGPTYARNRNGQQYRYYVSRPLLNHSEEKVGSISRVAATSIEAFVEAEILGRLPATEVKQWNSAIRAERVRFLRDLIAKVVVGSKEVEIVLALKGLALIGGSTKKRANFDREGSTRIRMPVRLKWWGAAKTITSIDGVTPHHPTLERNVIRALAYAHRWHELLRSGKVDSVGTLARTCSNDVNEIVNHLPLAFLSPKLVQALTDRDRPLIISLARLAECSREISWANQERLLLDGADRLPAKKRSCQF